MVGRRSAPRPSTSRPQAPASPSDSAVQIPAHNKDPIWSLRPWPVVLVFDEVEFDVPALTAADWLPYLMDFDLDTFVMEMLPELDEYIADQGEVDMEALQDAVLDLITVVGARSWWITVRLVGVVKGAWHIIGPDMRQRGVDLATDSLAMWLDIALVSVLSNMDKKDTTMFTMKLESRPDIEGDVDKMDTMEMNRDSFLSLGN